MPRVHLVHDLVLRASVHDTPRIQPSTFAKVRSCGSSGGFRKRPNESFKSARRPRRDSGCAAAPIPGRESTDRKGATGSRLLDTAKQRHTHALRQRGFKRKVGAGIREFRDAFQDCAPGAQQGGSGIEGREAASNEVGIDEMAAVGVERQVSASVPIF